MKNGNCVKQVAINLTCGCAPSIVCSVRKAGVANIIALNNMKQKYIAFIVIYGTDTDRTCKQRRTELDDTQRSERTD